MSNYNNERLIELEADNERLRGLLREAQAGIWSVARYVDLVPDGRAEAIDEVRSLSRRIDAALEGAEPQAKDPTCMHFMAMRKQDDGSYVCSFCGARKAALEGK